VHDAGADQIVYEELARGGPRHHHAVLRPGFPAADFPECGPVVLAYAEDRAAAGRAADLLRGAVEEQESAFDCPVYAPEEAVRRAVALAARRAARW
jgi:microcystin degradation protein MlrC